MTFGNLTAGRNNDCPASDAPTGVISLTIAGMQTDGNGLFTICIARPDQLLGELTLGPDAQGSAVRVIDLTGAANTCTFTLDRDVAPTGTAHGEGVCQAGGNAAGFALTIDGMVTLTRTCGDVRDTVAVPLAGTVAVAAAPL